MPKSRTIRFYDDDEQCMRAFEILKKISNAGGNKFVIEAIIHYNNYLNGIEETQAPEDVSLNDIKKLIRNEIQSAFAELNKEKNIVSVKEDATDETKMEQPKKVKEVPKPKADVEEVKETIIEKPKEEIKISAKALGFINQLGT